eukprot:TRINITY_DN484_c0_g1_i1.p1 TRINITY_DN484_c0_g1~~TRINITY_DN484_c0_g1_i1.p1  ORF type:complete len:256 (+),score=43.20 TRINITY_DN484_c0_g1_i1:45-812(+)
MYRLFLLLVLVTMVSAADIVIAGDSWGTYGAEPFKAMLRRNQRRHTVENIAVKGSTSKQWAEGDYLRNLRRSLSRGGRPVKIVWLTLMGNDAKNQLPGCAAWGGGSDYCVRQVIDNSVPHIELILKTVRDISPTTRVIAFGYDLPGFGSDNGRCRLAPNVLLPFCWGDTTCFNTHILKLQDSWKTLTESHPNLDTVNLLGSIQAASGDTSAAVGSPNLSQYSPAEYMLHNCIHPNEKGFFVIFENLWGMYLSKHL